MERSNIAIVLAAGSGRRMGAAVPKALLTLAGRPLMEWAVEAFDRHPLISEVCLVVNSAVAPAAQALQRGGAYPKLCRVVAGGKERSDSTRAALSAYAGCACNLLIHDAARPLVSAALITRVCHALEKNRAVVAALPVVDTIYRVQGEELASIPPREELRRAQTPQAFAIDVLQRAYAAAAAQPDFRPTDDCSVVATFAPDVAVRLVEGEERNLKITYPTDLAVAERYLRADDGEPPTTHPSQR